MSKVIVYVKFEDDFEYIWEARKYFEMVVARQQISGQKIHHVRMENEKGDCLKSWPNDEGDRSNPNHFTNDFDI